MTPAVLGGMIGNEVDDLKNYYFGIFIIFFFLLPWPMTSHRQGAQSHRDLARVNLAMAIGHGSRKKKLNNL